jgi:hypothetical protein
VWPLTTTASHVPMVKKTVLFVFILSWVELAVVTWLPMLHHPAIHAMRKANLTGKLAGALLCGENCC